MDFRHVRSLAKRLILLTITQASCIIVSAIALGEWLPSRPLLRILILSAIAAAMTALVTRLALRLVTRPLELLRRGIAAVREGCLEPIHIGRSSVEIEFLSESFNDMILSLAASRREIRQQQEFLEERIRQRTEALGDAMQRATAASRAKSDFLANMSHELRTPMTGILGMIDIVLDTPLTGEQRDQLETAQRCANSLLALLNDVLDHSKIEAGKMILERVPFDLRALLEDCVKAQSPKAARKGIRVECSLPDDLPDRVLGDPLRLRQIVMNLMSNAVKFTEAGEVRLMAAAGPYPRARALDLRLRVQDTGIGIPEAKLKTIFDNFTQADNSISRRYGGSGLGLSISRKLVQLHGGEIWVESVQGMGSVFHVRLPLGIAAAAAEPAGNETSPAAVAPLRSARVLVVEDTLVNQKVIVALLAKHGYQADVAGNGKQALDALATRPYDLVLMDVQMPVLDGLEATRLIRQNPAWAQLPVIAMTAHAMQGDRERCLEAGMDSYLAKPVNAAQLIACMEGQLSRTARAPAAPAPVPTPEPDATPSGLERLHAELSALSARVSRVAFGDPGASS